MVFLFLLRLDTGIRANTIPDPVTSTTLHSSGTVVATCSGQRSDPAFAESDITTTSDDEDESSNGQSFYDEAEENKLSRELLEPRSRTSDNSLKVWSL